VGCGCWGSWNKVRSLYLSALHKSCVYFSLSVCVAGVSIYFWRKRWVEVGIVSKIYIHPLKCGTPVLVGEVECNFRGPSIGSLKDRGFMVATPSYDAVDLRKKHTRLVLVELTQLEEGAWRLSAPGMEPCVFPEPSEDTTENSYRLLDIQVGGVDCGEDTAKWISSFLGEELRLVKHSHSDNPKRPPRPKYCKIYPQTMGKDCVPAYADVTPYMLTTEPSMADLNTRLPCNLKLDHRTFRPNFVIEGPNLKPWEEDYWTGDLMIGDTVFSYNKPCTRCIATKINPDTGTLFEGQEPLTTLKTFRQHNR